VLAFARLASRLPRGGFQIVRRLGIREARIETVAGPICCDLRESVCYPLLKYGTYPHAAVEIEWLRAAAGPEDVVYDIGANIGFTAALLASRGARVIAFEPSPRAFRMLKKNARAGIEARQVALSDKPGRLFFEERDRLDLSFVAETGTLAIEAVSIDSLGEAPTLIKIDVEGYEPAVLKGATETLRAGPVLFFEALDGDALKESAEIIRAANPAYRISAVTDMNYVARVEPSRVSRRRVGNLARIVGRRGAFAALADRADIAEQLLEQAAAAA